MKQDVEKGLSKAGIRNAQRHLFVCLGPDCCHREKEGEPLWKHIKERLKQENVKIMRTKADCFRICAGGPWVVIYPEGTWYGEVTKERFDRILKEHILGGRPVEEWVAAQNALHCPGHWQPKSESDAL
jgi:(2Fe-2S) ferredoxin